MTDEQRIKPVVILVEGSMSKRDIQRLRSNGLCVVESKNPSNVRFLDPPPFGYSQQEEAAIELSRVLLTEGKIGSCTHRAAIGSMYADILLRGDPLKRILRVEKAKP
jgi:hypothetical protein